MGTRGKFILDLTLKNNMKKVQHPVANEILTDGIGQSQNKQGGKYIIFII